jgi:precorrin-6Y C5,15-methyltransferase (decarboxylating)
MNVDIVGVGLGPGTLTSDAAAALDRADLLIGSPRLLSEHSSVPATVQATRPDQVLAAIQASGADQICVLMSGDTGFYSGAHGVLSGLLAAGFRLSDRPWPDDGSATADTVRVLPGIASPVLLAARLGIPWEHAALVSAHGRGTSISGAVRHSRYTFVLTGDNMAELADELIAAGFEDLHCLGGSDLGLSAEQIADCRVDQLPHRKWPSLSVLLVENPNQIGRASCRERVCRRV